MNSTAPKIFHIIYRLDIGGLETVLVKFINRCPDDKYSHVIVSLTEVTSFSERLEKKGVSIHALHKRPGKDFRIFFKLFWLMIKEKPDVVHTYNLPTLEYQFAAWLSGVPARVHAEHGRDYSDPLGMNPKHLFFRRLLSPLINAWVPVSQDLARWLVAAVGVKQERIRMIYNGVEIPDDICCPVTINHVPAFFLSEDCYIITTVGRLDPVKDQSNLLRAFGGLLKKLPDQAGRLRLVIVGGGSLGQTLREQAIALGVDCQVWLAGPRDDVAQLLPYCNLFVLSSVAEGIPMTVLEAMAAGLPVVATNVGGLTEIIRSGIDGLLVAPQDPEALADAMAFCVRNKEKVSIMARAGWERVSSQFSLEEMTEQYIMLYDSLLAGQRRGVSRNA